MINIVFQFLVFFILLTSNIFNSSSLQNARLDPIAL